MTDEAPPRIVVTGTDTGIGKTVFSAALAHALEASYWKPVQSGLDETAFCRKPTGSPRRLRRISRLPSTAWNSIPICSIRRRSPAPSS
jgi:dethiobiotin synthetase